MARATPKSLSDWWRYMGACSNNDLKDCNDFKDLKEAIKENNSGYAAPQQWQAHITSFVQFR